MFARSVSMRLKPNSVAEFTRLIENEVLSLLRKQKGFKDEITLVAPGGAEAVAISLSLIRLPSSTASTSVRRIGLSATPMAPTCF